MLTPCHSTFLGKTSVVTPAASWRISSSRVSMSLAAAALSSPDTHFSSVAVCEMSAGSWRS